MASVPYMQFYIADYLADTQHLTTMQHGAYLLLIMHYYQIGKSLAGNGPCLARICRTSVSKWLRMEPVLKEFFTIQNGRWYHKRIEDDLDRMASKSGKSRVAANIRWGKSEQNHSIENDADAMRTQCGRNAFAMPSEQNRSEQNRSIMSRSENEPSQKNTELKKQAIEIIDFLNLKTGKKFRRSDTNLKMIIARLKSGATVMDCRDIIIRKTRAWINDEHMSQYLRPSTLFNATKFEQYIGELVVVEEN